MRSLLLIACVCLAQAPKHLPLPQVTKQASASQATANQGNRFSQYIAFGAVSAAATAAAYYVPAEPSASRARKSHTRESVHVEGAAAHGRNNVASGGNASKKQPSYQR
eukprot:1110104-Pleurochrysis_carterae.AAC.1